MPNNFVLLERIELNASAASVVFANIPQTGYTDLKIVMSIKTASANRSDAVTIKPNGSAANGTARRLYGNGASATSDTLSVFDGGQADGNSAAVANTWSNGEVYIPNYTSSNYKSASVDAVSEGNETTAYAELGATLWSSTAAITSLEISCTNNMLQYSTFSLYGLAALGTTPAIAPKASGGNIIDFDGTYWIHTFLTNGTFTPQIGLSCDVLVVAGGGAGAWGNGGGGGAGGLLSFTSQSVAASAQTVTVGAGAARITTNVQQQEANGSDSQFASLTAAVGGGGGASFSNLKGSLYNGKSGGSGGGGGGTDSGASNTGGAATSGQGNTGGAGTSNPTNNAGGGGGGAGGAGGNGTNPSTAGAGGAGTASSISGSSVTYAGGGGGGSNGTSAGTGGAGGGGNGGFSAVGTAGTINRGGGGGGGGNTNNGANGGSGVVIIRYLA
jgi:hypothetical protein